MSCKRKADCTPEEWEAILASKRLSALSPEKREKRRAYFKEYDKKRPKRVYKPLTEKQRQRKNELRRARRANLTEEELAEVRKKEAEYMRQHPQKFTEEQKKRRNEYQKEWRKRRKENMTNEEKEKEKEKIRIRNHERYVKNQDKRKEAQQQYNKENKEKRRQYREETKLPFELYAYRLTIDEDPVADKDGFLMVRDYHTKEYFYPKRWEVENRIQRINGIGSGECHLYSSERSKRECPVYNATRDPATIRGYLYHPARDPEFRKMVIERANGHCERCGKKCDSLIAHHKIPVKPCAMFSGDIDNGMALCPECHREVHSTDGCRLHELAAEKRETA